MPPALTEPQPAQIEPLYVRLPAGRRKANGLDSNGRRRDEVAADQRRRLQRAMIEAVAAHGYAATTTRGLSKLAGVSKEHMYKQFPGKESYFLATYDTIVERGVERIGAAYRSPGAWQAKLRAAFDAYAAEVVAEPGAAQLALVEVLGAGPVALARMRGTRLISERIVSASFSEAPDGVALPPLIVKGIVCGIERITRHLLLAGGVQELPALADELLAWALSYRSPAAAALAAHHEAPVRCWPPARVENDRARILRCAAQIAAVKGYAQLSPARIACDAGVTEARFDELFESAEECFLDALDRLGLETLVCAASASRSSEDRLAGVHRGIVALMEHVASNPVLVGVAFVEIFAVGPAGIKRRHRLLGQFTDLLARSVPRSQRPSDLVGEASIGAILGIVHHHVTRGATHRLPGLADYATYLALAPVIGGEAAVGVILAERAAGAQLISAA